MSGVANSNTQILQKKKKKILSEYKIKKSSDVAELESSIDKYIFGFIYVPLTSVHFL